MTTEERWVGIEDVAIHLGVAKDLVCRWIVVREPPGSSRRGAFLLQYKGSNLLLTFSMCGITS